MAEVKKLEEMGLNTLDSKSNLYEVNGIVTKDTRSVSADEYYKMSKKSKKDLRETFTNINNLKETEGKYAKMFNGYVTKFEEKAKSKGIGIIMSGNPGTGKTFFSNCIWNELRLRNKVYKTSFGKYVRDIQNKFEEDKYLNIVKNADLVILDDLGNEYFKDDEKGSWKKEVLFNLFDTIYENEICLIITTNLDETKLKEFLEIKGSHKVYDRILERCAGFEFNWESRRAKLYEDELRAVFAID